jgi:hypothetical protein
LLLLLIILGPIILFSSLNPILEMNNVLSGKVNVELIVANRNSNSGFQVFNLFESNNLEITKLSDAQVNLTS